MKQMNRVLLGLISLQVSWEKDCLNQSSGSWPTGIFTLQAYRIQHVSQEWLCSVFREGTYALLKLHIGIQASMLALLPFPQLKNHGSP